MALLLRWVVPLRLVLPVEAVLLELPEQSEAKPVRVALVVLAARPAPAELDALAGPVLVFVAPHGAVAGPERRADYHRQSEAPVFAV